MMTGQESASRLIRTIQLPLARPVADKAMPSGDLLPGLLALDLLGPARIEIRYDLRLTSLPAVEAWLAARGLALSGNWPARLLRRWIEFTDANRLDQAAIVHKCCSVPPRRE